VFRRRREDRRHLCREHPRRVARRMTRLEECAHENVFRAVPIRSRRLHGEPIHAQRDEHDEPRAASFNTPHRPGGLAIGQIEGKHHAKLAIIPVSGKICGLWRTNRMFLGKITASRNKWIWDNCLRYRFLTAPIRTFSTNPHPINGIRSTLK